MLVLLDKFNVSLNEFKVGGYPNWQSVKTACPAPVVYQVLVKSGEVTVIPAHARPGLDLQTFRIRRRLLGQENKS